MARMNNLMGPPYEGAFAITPSDSADFTFSVRCIYVGGTGDVVLVNEDGTTATLKAVPVGTQIQCRARRVNATSTTATFLVGMY
jgi:hypothetical protein